MSLHRKDWIVFARPTCRAHALFDRLAIARTGDAAAPARDFGAYPQLTRDDILAALAFAAEKMRDESYIPLDSSAT